NTIIMDRADALGLAQLHQLRGRVGRSHHRAYAYLLVPSLRALKPDAAARLDAVEAMGELGSGFVLATQDLEIRGAGELLGEEQSGQIEEVGFTLYADLLAEAVASLKSGALDDRPFGANSCEVDLGATALLPDDYIPDVHTRLTFYKRLSEAHGQAALDELQAEMVDRFGKLPEAAQRLLEAMRLRQRAQALGIVKLRAGGKSITLEFGPQPSVEPRTIIQLIQSQPRLYRLEGQSKLHHAALLEKPEARAAAAAQLLATLAGKS
ncbi:MAG: transcription-repair coupling factor, partial [Hydrocarboniphaga effusa]|nr:transcription-repair coupling factor [Hydrocarboniphaga effusa]